MIKLAFTLSMMILLSACTTLTQTNPINAIPDSVRQESCLSALTSLDNLGRQSSGTLITNRMPGVPWLRHNRLITHDIALQKNTKHLDKLLRSMSSLTRQGLKYELAATPQPVKRQWQKQYQIKQSIDSFIATCSERLIA